MLNAVSPFIKSLPNQIRPPASTPSSKIGEVAKLVFYCLFLIFSICYYIFPTTFTRMQFGSKVKKMNLKAVPKKIFYKVFPSLVKKDVLSTQPEGIFYNISQFSSNREKSILCQVNRSSKKRMDHDLAWKDAFPEKHVRKGIPLKLQVKEYYSWGLTEEEHHAFAWLQHGLLGRLSHVESLQLETPKFNLIYGRWCLVTKSIWERDKSCNKIFYNQDIAYDMGVIKGVLRRMQNKTPINDRFKCLKDKKSLSCLVRRSFAPSDLNLPEDDPKRKCDKEITLSGEEAVKILERAFDRLDLLLN